MVRKPSFPGALLLPEDLTTTGCPNAGNNLKQNKIVQGYLKS